MDHQLIFMKFQKKKKKKKKKKSIILLVILNIYISIFIIFI